MKRVALSAVLLNLFAAGFLQAQSSLSLDLDDPLYTVLDVLSVRGEARCLSEVKPYTLREARTAVEAAAGGLSGAERRILERLAPAAPAAGGAGRPVRGRQESELRLDLTGGSALHAYNALGADFRGSLGGFLDYRFDLGLTLDKVDPGAFVPYTFSKRWDGFHIWFGAGKYSNGVNDHLNISFYTQPEIDLPLFDERLLLRWGRMRREWGAGEGSVLLSGTARPFDGIEIRARPGRRIQYSFVTGSLGDWMDKNAEQKMLSAHLLEVWPASWLRLAAWESVVWGKRLELAYLNPLTSFYLAQNFVAGDMDNIAFGGEASVTLAPWARWYFSAFLDEIETDHLDRFFQFAKNQYAWSTGIKAPVPWLPFTLLTLQYTKIEPYCYTHYPQSYPFFDPAVQVNIAYTNDGENLGYPLPPNSDELLVQLASVPHPGWTATLRYRLVRHGDGDHLSGQIEGNIDTWLDYNNLDAYPWKDFLHDGVYEWIHSATVAGSWSPAAFRPLTVRAEYSFVHARNFGNLMGNTATRHLVGVGAVLRF